MDRGAWWARVHRVAKCLSQLSNFHFHIAIISYREAIILFIYFHKEETCLAAQNRTILTEHLPTHCFSQLLMNI